MKWLKEIYSQHPLLGIGVGLYVILQTSMFVLSKFYDDLNDSPSTLVGLMVVLLMSSILLTAIGGVLFLSRGPNTKTFRSRAMYFFKGYWKSAKLAILLTLMFFMGIALYVLWLNLSFS
ncbi:hypothetical protein KC950_02385 [Candidatus Saccharibacteria bacterium]|nr:hypothetical protein [Candidatus Saccharibacteria bacterium]